MAFYHLRVSDGLTLIVYCSFGALSHAISTFASLFICLLTGLSRHCRKGTFLMCFGGVVFLEISIESETTYTTMEKNIFLDLVFSISSYRRWRMFRNAPTNTGNFDKISTLNPKYVMHAPLISRNNNSNNREVYGKQEMAR